MNAISLLRRFETSTFLTGISSKSPLSAPCVGVFFVLALWWQTAEANFYPGTSQNWAGVWERAPNANFTRVGAAFHVPDSTTCNATSDRVATWVGLNTYAQQSIEQTGITVRCDTGSPTYVAWYQMLPGPPVFIDANAYPVYASDNIIGVVQNNGDTTYTLTLWNTTRNWSFVTTQVEQFGNAITTGAEAIVELPRRNDGSLSTNPDYGNIPLALLDGDVTSLDGTGPSGAHIVFRSPQPGDYEIDVLNTIYGDGSCCRSTTDGITYGTSLSPFTHVNYTGP